MIIGSRWRYEGESHRGLRGHRVQIVAVSRGEIPDERRVLTTDDEIGEIMPSDLIEIAPIIVEKGGDRISFVTSDARVEELVPE